MTGDAARRGGGAERIAELERRIATSNSLMRQAIDERNEAMETHTAMAYEIAAWQRRAERWKEAARVYRVNLQHAHIALRGVGSKWNWREFRRYWSKPR